MMADLMISLILVLYYIKVVVSITMKLTAPTTIYPGQPITLNCTSSTVPEGLTAEFLVNGMSFNNVQYHDGSCFTTINGGECVEEECLCSRDRKTYILVYTEKIKGPKINFACRMKFLVINNPNGKFLEANIEIKLRDVRPPVIAFMPLSYFEDIIRMKCAIAVSKQLDISFKWRCGNADVFPYKILSNKNSTVSYAKIPLYQNETCICTVLWSEGKYNVTGSAVTPTRRPIIQLLEKTSCVLGNAIKLQCSLNQNFHLLSGIWYHSFDTHFVRTISGLREKNSILLEIDSCQNADMGDYTCSLRFLDINSNKSHRFNNSVNLKIEGPPWITNIDVNTTNNKTVLSVLLYSYEPLKSIKWLKSNGYIENSTASLQICYADDVYIVFDGKNVTVNGLHCSVTLYMIIRTDVQKYGCCVENSKGEICRGFKTGNSEKGLADGSFEIKDVATLITGFTLVMALVILSSGLVAHRFSLQNTELKEACHITSLTQPRAYIPQTSRDVATPSNSRIENMYLTPEAESTYDEILDIENNGYLDPIVNHYDIADENAMH